MKINIQHLSTHIPHPGVWIIWICKRVRRGTDYKWHSPAGLEVSNYQQKLSTHPAFNIVWNYENWTLQIEMREWEWGRRRQRALLQDCLSPAWASPRAAQTWGTLQHLFCWPCHHLSQRWIGWVAVPGGWSSWESSGFKWLAHSKNPSGSCLGVCCKQEFWLMPELELEVDQLEKSRGKAFSTEMHGFVSCSIPLGQVPPPSCPWGQK